MANRYDSILDTIGNTPIIKLNNLAPEGINLFVKVESFNPMGSVKDRFALAAIEDAEQRGELKPGQTIVEATSGNTGIALAMVCAQKGYPLVITMAESFSIERRKMMRFLGAQVVLTPASEKGSGMVAKAEELAEQHGWWQAKQFENPANADMHARTTAVEILQDFDDIGLDYWVSGFGTGGTLSGVSRVLKEQSPNTKIMLCEPDNAQIIASGITQPKDDQGKNSASHPNFRPHLMQGWTPDFIPLVAEEALLAERIDGYVAIDGNDSMRCAKLLAQKEGIFVGTSAGATLSGALKVAETAAKGSNILCMLPDTGERYLSTPLFDNISSEMSQQEIALSKSTPGYRFDVSSAAAVTQEKQELNADAVAEVDQIVSSNDGEFVMFALEWCEFCWSIKKMFDAYGIAYQSVDLDSVVFQEDNRGGKMRAALRAKTTWDTFPQIFLNNEFVGGATDVFDAVKDQSMLQKLSELKIDYKQDISVDPYTFLPDWLHPR